MDLKKTYDQNLGDVNSYLEKGKDLFDSKTLGYLQQTFSRFSNLCSTYNSREDLKLIKDRIGFIRISLGKSKNCTSEQAKFLTQLEEKVINFEIEVDNL